MKTYGLRFLLLSAMLLTGCASARIQSSDLLLRHSFQQPLHHAQDRQEVLTSGSPQTLARETELLLSESTPTERAGTSTRYLAQAATVARQDKLNPVLSDTLPLGYYRYKTDSYLLSQKQNKTDEFDDFEKEFDDVQLDTESGDVFDPLIGYNRAIYHFNDKLYFWLLKPVATGYGMVIPEGGRIAVDNFFRNLSFPVRFVNNALQGKFKRAGIETARFAVNTTIGFFGFFDLADEWYDLKPYEEDFGQTLGHYGVGDGFPFWLPFLPPSNARDTLGIIPDLYFYPIDLLYQGDKYIINPLFLGIFIWETINRTSLHIGVYENMTQNALDPYTMLRDAYKQNREARIKE